MASSKHNDRLADRINRVITAVDLADVSPADIDAFLDALGWQPFPQEKIRRILSRAGIEPVRGSKATPDGLSPDQKRASHGGKSTCRLICEQLDGRILPSQFGSPWAGRILDAYQTTISESSVLTVVLWEDKGMLAVQGFARATDEPSAAVPVETLNSLFANFDHQGGAGFDNLDGSGDVSPHILAWDFLAPSACASHAEGLPLLLAS